jgi:RNA polymerase sigma factor (sigma-70 family)
MKIDPKHLTFANVVIRTEVKKLRERGVIRRADAEDIASELVAQLLEVWDRFDPERGTREAFINQVVSTRIVSILRERRAQKRRGTTEAIDAGSDRLIDRIWSGDGWRHRIELRVDLEVAFSRLNSRQHAICDQLLREALSPAAKQMGVPRSTLRDAVAKIREVFRDAGLEEYF